MAITVIMLLALASMPAIVFYRAAEWCLRRRLRAPAYLVLAVLGLGTLYGLLRLTGVLVFPGDHTWSVDFFDASWRDDGVRFLVPFGGGFAGTAAALFPGRKKGNALSDSQNEEKM